MPWQLSADLRRFKKLTLGAPIVMGRKTYESIGRPLPGRLNVVVTRSPESMPATSGVTYVSTHDEIQQATRDAAKVFVIGGATIYDWLLPQCSVIYLTRVWTQTAGDTSIELDLTRYTCRYVERIPQTKRDSMPTEFQIWHLP
jgi:dihydrofolate reductase